MPSEGKHGYEAYNYFVYDLIFRAYQLKCPDQLIGLPRWLR